METVQTKSCVLDKAVIARKLKRMALELAEQNSEETHLLIAGIEGNGVIVAKALLAELQRIGTFHADMIKVQLNKKDPVNVSFDQAVELENKVVILVDDVANTGKTMLYALKPFLAAHPKKIQTLVLVERSHKLFPIQTDYAGLSVATTLQEHIAVETEGDDITGAWLY